MPFLWELARINKSSFQYQLSAILDEPHKNIYFINQFQKHCYISLRHNRTYA